MSKPELYLITYDYDGQDLADVAVLDGNYTSREQAHKWLRREWEAMYSTEDPCRYKLTEAYHLRDLTDAEGNFYAISHTINTYLTEVREGSKL